MASWDVAVVGGGGAGMAAAIEAADHGARVLLLEAAETPGGSTQLSGGVYYAADTDVQREAGIDDSVDAFFEYYMTLSQWLVDADVVRRLCDRAEPGLRWLRDLGVRFRAHNVYASGVESVPRGHLASGGGAAIAGALERAVRERGIEVRCNSRVIGLARGDDRVRGVVAGGEDLPAAAVVLTTGGFGHNPDLIARWFPDADAGAGWTTTLQAPTCVGDGIALGEEAGASLAGHNRGLVLPSPGPMPWDDDAATVTPGWAIFVNRDGRRFVSELARNATIGGAVTAQGGACWAVFDDAAHREPLDHPVYGVRFNAPIHAAWTPLGIARGVAAGRIQRAATIEELAGRIGVPAAALELTVERYNRDCAAGEDTQYFKDPRALRPIARPPLYAREIRPCVVVVTGTGLRIDPDAAVLDGLGRPIPGLYAAGEVVGNVLGPRYIGSGNSITNCIVYGRIAGERSAAHALAARG